MDKPMVEVGQRFRSRGQFDTRVWQVDALFEDAHRLPHVRLCQVDKSNEYRTLACEVLLDTQRFQPAK